MLNAGYVEEARSPWRSWLLRAVAGDPADLQIMYGIGGERRLDERVLEWLPGFEGSEPVRVGNAASTQLQLDVYGEVLDAAYQTLDARGRPRDIPPVVADARAAAVAGGRLARRRTPASGRCAAPAATSPTPR